MAFNFHDCSVYEDQCSEKHCFMHSKAEQKRISCCTIESCQYSLCFKNEISKLKLISIAAGQSRMCQLIWMNTQIGHRISHNEAHIMSYHCLSITSCHRLCKPSPMMAHYQGIHCHSPVTGRTASHLMTGVTGQVKIAFVCWGRTSLLPRYLTNNIISFQTRTP